MIEIDRTKCTNCGICFDMCPSTTIGIRSTDGQKEVYLKYPEFCNVCGLCMAFCKPQAILHQELSYDDFKELDEIDIAPAAMKNLLFARRSVRRYKEEAVPANLIEELIEVGTHAGTGTNLQSVNFVVVNDKQFLAELELSIIDVWFTKLRPFEVKALQPILRKVYGPETTDAALLYYEYLKRRREDNDLEGTVFFNAPTLLLAHDDKRNPVGSINCAIAVRNMETLALTMGLGTCWNGFLIYAENQKPRTINPLLGLNNSRRVWGATMLGYPRYKSRVKIPRREREVIYI